MTRPSAHRGEPRAGHAARTRANCGFTPGDYQNTTFDEDGKPDFPSPPVNDDKAERRKRARKIATEGQDDAVNMMTNWQRCQFARAGYRNSADFLALARDS